MSLDRLPFRAKKGRHVAARFRPSVARSASPARVDVRPFNNLTGEGFVLRYLVVSLAPIALGGCFFFMVPLPSQVFSSANACAVEGVQVGQALKHVDGRVGKVTDVYGRHQRCQEAARPMLVTVEYAETK
jgi:hypothetical protein